MSPARAGPIDIFADARAKIDRAKKHLDDLTSVITMHIAAFPVVYGEPITGVQPNVSSMPFTVPSFPVKASPILGDLIHNLRTSLDLAATAMARANGHVGDNEYFPFSNDATSLQDQIKKKNFRRCGRDAVAVLESLRPYKGGNVELRAIHDLDIMDKHRRLIPKSTVTVQLGYDPAKRRPVPGDPHGYKFEFPPETALAGRELIKTCEELVQLCEGILEEFAGLKFG